MGKLETTAARAARRLRNKQNRDNNDKKFLDKYGIHPAMATPKRMAAIDFAKRKKQGHQKVLKDEFEKALAYAKDVAITSESFEYCNLAPRSKDVLERYSAELRDLIVSLCDDNDDKAADNVIRDFMQAWIDNGDLVQAPVRIGFVPKARVYNSGRIEVLRLGEPDADLMREHMPEA